jgi:hypothetical protein
MQCSVHPIYSTKSLSFIHLLLSYIAAKAAAAKKKKEKEKKEKERKKKEEAGELLR